MLNTYLQRTQQLLSDIKQELINPAFLTSFVNTARGQLAGEAECIRVIGTLSTVNGTQSYLYSTITTAAGVQGVLNVRRINYTSGGGQKFVAPLPWEWFDLYYLNNTAPTSAAPMVWAQYAQGTAGSFYLSPIPNAVYALKLDSVCYPIDLVDDTTVEAIPYPWTDAVSYFAAYLGCMYAQVPDKGAQMLSLYKDFTQRARRFSTPAVVPYQYEQVPMPATPLVQSGTSSKVS